MIQAIFEIDSDDNIRSFVVKGHAGYAEEGHDIVCAAVSALCVNAVNSIETFTEDEFVCDEGNKNGGYLSFSFTSDDSDDFSKESILLLYSLKLGLEGIRDSDNAEYIPVETKEV